MAAGSATIGQSRTPTGPPATPSTARYAMASALKASIPANNARRPALLRPPPTGEGQGEERNAGQTTHGRASCVEANCKEQARHDRWYGDQKEAGCALGHREECQQRGGPDQVGLRGGAISSVKVNAQSGPFIVRRSPERRGKSSIPARQLELDMHQRPVLRRRVADFKATLFSLCAMMKGKRRVARQ